MIKVYLQHPDPKTRYGIDYHYQDAVPLFEIEEIDVYDIIKYKEKTYATSSFHSKLNYAVVSPIEMKESPEETDESLFTCPYCGYEDGDSFELSNSEDNHSCPHCNSIVSYERFVEVSYQVTPVKRAEIREI